MKLSSQAINFFENLAVNVHHHASATDLLEKQSNELKAILSLNDSESLRRAFSEVNYFADSIKVTIF